MFIKSEDSPPKEEVNEEALSDDDTAFTPEVGKPKKKHRQQRQTACMHCERRKRSCDRVVPRCSRCISLGRECIYKHTLTPTQHEELKLKEQEQRKEKAKRKAIEISRQVELIPKGKRSTGVPSVNEMALIETMMDELFLTSCLENFDRTMGAFFNFRGEISSSELSLLHSTPALSVRTDSVLACVCRGMGWSTQAERYLQRAKSNAVTVIADAPSKDNFSAISMLGISSFGGDLAYSKLLMGNACRMKSENFVIDLSQAYNYYLLPYFGAIISPAAMEITLRAMATIHQRAQLRARHVRAALESKLSLDEIATYGPWDYFDFRCGYYSEVAEVAEGAARTRLQELDDAEQILESLFPSVVESVPELANMLLERRIITTNAVRSALEYFLGEFSAAKMHAKQALDAFGSITSVMWFFGSALDYVHVIDIAIGMEDTELFRQGYEIMRKMAPVVPWAQRLVSSLSDVRAMMSTSRIEIVEGVEEMMEEALESSEWIDSATQ